MSPSVTVHDPGRRRRRLRVLLPLCGFALVQALVHSGLTAATLSSISRRYGFSNVQAGLMLAAYDFAAATAGFCIALAVAAAERDDGKPTLAVSTGRARRLRQLWRGCTRGCLRICFARKEVVLAAGLAAFAVGTFMYSAPQFAHGTYGVPPIEAHVCDAVNASSANATAGNATTGQAGSAATNDGMCTGDALTSGKSLLGLFIAAQIVLGVGAAPLYTVGPALIDDTWEGSASASRALSFFFASAAIGPAIGFVVGGLTLSRWVEGESQKPVGIQPDSRFWVGQWYAGFWLGAVLAAALLPLFVCSLVLGRKARRHRELELSQYSDLGHDSSAVDEEGIVAGAEGGVIHSGLDGGDGSTRQQAAGGSNGNAHAASNSAATDDHDDGGEESQLALVVAGADSSRAGSADGLQEEAIDGSSLLKAPGEDFSSPPLLQEGGGIAGDAGEVGVGGDGGDDFGEAAPTAAATAPPGLLSLTFIALTLALTFEVFGKSAIVPFVPLVVQEIFGVSASTAAYTVGAVLVPAAILGTVFGGVLVMLTRMSTRTQILYCALTTFVGACVFVGASFTMVACDQLAFAGINAPAAGQGANGTHIPDWLRELVSNHSTGGDKRFEHECNLGCACSVEYEPVCSSADGLTYLNGCLAGCSEAHVDDEGMPTSYANCTCALSDGQDSVAPGECARACDALYGFLALLFVAIFITFMNASPVMSVFMECAGSPENRTLSLAVGGLAYRLFGAIPGPIAEGWLLDLACSYESPCTDACVVHSPHGVRVAITTLPLSAFGVSAICYVVAWWLYGRKPRGAGRAPSSGSRSTGRSWRLPLAGSLRRLFSRRPWRALSSRANATTAEWEQLEL